MNGASANDEVTSSAGGYEESHIAKDPCTVAVVPRQVDGALWHVKISCYAYGTSFLLLGQRMEVRSGISEDVFNKFPRNDVALQIACIDSAFGRVWNWRGVLVLSFGVDVDRQDPWRWPC